MAEHFGVEFFFQFKGTTPVVEKPQKPAVLIGPCKYILEAFESDGGLDSDALLTGPAYKESAAQTALQWADVAGHTFGIRPAGGAVQEVLFGSGTSWTIGKIVAYLNAHLTGFVASFLEEAGPKYRLVIKTVAAGNSVRFTFAHANVTTYFGFVNGQTIWGFGSYTGTGMMFPFVALPDPRGKLSQTVLDGDSVKVYASYGGQAVELEGDEAWERNWSQRKTWKTMKGTGNAQSVDLAGASPFVREYSGTLSRWTKEGNNTLKFWVPGTDAHCLLGADPADATAYMPITAKGGAAATEPSEMGSYHGTKGVWKVVTVLSGNAGADPTTIALANGTLTITYATAQNTLATLRAWLLLSADALALITCGDIVGLGTTPMAPGTYGTYGGIDPVIFSSAQAGAAAVVMGRVPWLAADTLGVGGYMILNVDGCPLTTVQFPLDAKLDDGNNPTKSVVHLINAALTATIGTAVTVASKVAVGADAWVLKLTAPAATTLRYGFSSTIYIKETDLGNRLFVGTQTVANILPCTAAAPSKFAVELERNGGIPFTVIPGDTISNLAGTRTAVVAQVDNGADHVFATFTTPMATAFGAGDVYVVPAQQVSDYLVRHQGLSYKAIEGDTLWDGGDIQATIMGTSDVHNSALVVQFAGAVIELGDAFDKDHEFEHWAIRANNLDSTPASERPYPELMINTTDDTIIVRNDVLVDTYGRLLLAPTAPLYAEYTGLRQDVSAKYRKTFLAYEDITVVESEIGPFTPENPLGWAVMLAMAASGGTRTIYALGVESDDLVGYAASTPVLDREKFWMPIVLSGDDDVNDWLAAYLVAKQDPTAKREYATVLTCGIPTEQHPTTIGSGLSAATNDTGHEEIITVDVNKLSLLQALSAEGIDPSEVTSATGLFIRISGGGATSTEAARKWLVSSVDGVLNQVTVKYSFDVSENTDGFYYAAKPPKIASANINVYLRGEAITLAADKRAALIAKAATYANRKICLSPSNGFDVTYNGQSTLVANYFGTAAAAGYWLVHPVEFPLSGYTIPGLDAVHDTDEIFADIDGIDGLMFLVNGEDGESVQVAMSHSTSIEDVKYHEISIGSGLDSLVARVRQHTAGSKKKNTGEDLVQDLYTGVGAAIEAWTTAREGVRCEVVAIRNHATQINAQEILLQPTTFVPCGVLYVYMIV